jgi:hypothetical protein
VDSFLLQAAVLQIAVMLVRAYFLGKNQGNQVVEVFLLASSYHLEVLRTVEVAVVEA